MDRAANEMPNEIRDTARTVVVRVVLVELCNRPTRSRGWPGLARKYSSNPGAVSRCTGPQSLTVAKNHSDGANAEGYRERRRARNPQPTVGSNAEHLERLETGDLEGSRRTVRQEVAQRGRCMHSSPTAGFIGRRARDSQRYECACAAADDAHRGQEAGSSPVQLQRNACPPIASASESGATSVLGAIEGQPRL